MKIKAIKINNFLGVNEYNYNPGNINIFEGAKGSGKSSILEAIETAMTNIKRRTEVIKHGAEEATLFVQLDDGLEINRKIRNGKADYFKMSQEGKGIKSTESELRKLLSGDIFRPLDFISMKQTEQTAIILNMIKMDYSAEEVKEWFDINVNFDESKHLLQILKGIETNLYDERQEVNRHVTTLRNQISGIEKELPPNYKGEDWKSINIKDYYAKVSEAQKVNSLIAEAERLVDSIGLTVENIKLTGENDFKAAEARKSEKVQLLKDDIQSIEGGILELKQSKKDLLVDLEKEKVNLTEKMNKEMEEIKAKYSQIEKDLEAAVTTNLKLKEESILNKGNAKLLTEQGIVTVLKLAEQERSVITENINTKIAHEKERAVKATKYLGENSLIDIAPIEAEIDNITTMQSYIREWEKTLDLKTKLAEEESKSQVLTEAIKTAREKPVELLTKHELPIDGIGVDDKGCIRINGTLLDGLSDGEKLEAAFKIALQRIGELRIMCLDGFEKLNLTEQKKVVKLCEDNDIQAFITITTDGEGVTSKLAL